MERTEYFDFSVKALGEAGTFEGYVSTFGNVDRQGDIVLPGAFSKTIKRSKGKVPFLMVHRTWQIVGFGTDAAEDEHGLKVTGEFTMESDAGRNAHATVMHAQKVGAKLGLSMGYAILKNGAEFDEATQLRKLKHVELLEYSIAPVPANTEARITGVKAAADWTEREFEEYLRDAGFSQRETKRIIAEGFKSVSPRDAGADDLPVSPRDADAGRREADAFMATFRKSALIDELRGIHHG